MRQRGFPPVPCNGFFYAWGEALRSLNRNKWMTIASIGVVVVTCLCWAASCWCI